MAIRVCKHCRNRAAKLKWQDLMRAGKWCGSHSWLVLPPELEPFANQSSNELEPFANQGSKCANFLGSNCWATKFWKKIEVLTRCPSVYIYTSIHTYIYIYLYTYIHTYIYIMMLYIYNIVRFHIDYISHLKTMALPRLRQGDAAMSCGCHEAHVASAGSQLQDTVTAGKPGFPMLGGWWFPCS